MSRQQRDLETSEWFHVYNRGHDGQDIFSLDGDRSLFEALVGDAVAATSAEVHAFALMSNHFHLLVHAPDQSLSNFVHRLTSRYAAAYNQRTSRTGAVFGGRFGSVPIDTHEQLLTVARYIERNPLAFVPAAALARYRHSSFGCYLGCRPTPTWLSTSVLLHEVDIAGYGCFVLDAQPSDRLPLGELPALTPIEPHHLFAHIDAVTGQDPLATSGSARNLATAICLRLRIASVPDLAALFAISEPAVRQAARRGRIRLDTDPTIKRAHDRIVDGLGRAA